MNSENGKTSDPQRLLLDLSVKLNLKRSDRYVEKTNNFSVKDMYIENKIGFYLE